MRIKEISFGSKDYYKSIELRDKILRKPLGMVFTEDFLALDKDQYHIGMFKAEQIVGILILKPLNKSHIKMRQVAVDFVYQGKGYGKKIVEYSENFAKQRKYRSIELNARKESIKFYERLNYKLISDYFYEIGILHKKMIKYF